jgi:hypothetical protein
MNQDATGCPSAPNYAWVASNLSGQFYFPIGNLQGLNYIYAFATVPSYSFGSFSITAENSPPAAPAPPSLILGLIGLAGFAVFYAARYRIGRVGLTGDR